MAAARWPLLPLEAFTRDALAAALDAKLAATERTVALPVGDGPGPLSGKFFALPSTSPLQSTAFGALSQRPSVTGNVRLALPPLSGTAADVLTRPLSREPGHVVWRYVHGKYAIGH